MVYSYGSRIDNDSNAITKIDEENKTAETTGYVNGEYVEFSGGGGGSSDFSTATVTATYGHTVWGAFYGDFPPEAPMEGATYYQNSASNTLILYKGVGMISVSDPVQSVSGNIQHAEGTRYFVTGDCTIDFA